MYSILHLLLGNMHSLSDIPFIWGYPIVPDNPEVERESMLELLDLLPWSDEDKEMTNYVMTLFSNFAKTGLVCLYEVRFH